MKRAAILCAAIALAGCEATLGNAAEGTAPANRSIDNGSAQAPALPAPPPSPLVGRWADISSSCENPVEIFANGTFRAVDGSRGHWRADGDRLTINVGARVFSFRVLSVTRDRIVTEDAQGQRGESVRCP